MALNIGEIVTSAAGATAVGGILSDTWQAVLGDKIAVYRLRNAAKLQVKLHEDMEKLGLSLRSAKIPDRYAFAWFEEATKEDEPEMQALFAALLARAAAGDENASDRRLIDLLGRMTPDDAVSLVNICERLKAPVLPQVIPEMSLPDPSLHRSLTALLGKDAWITIEHLTSLGIIESRPVVLKRGIHRISRSPVGGEPFPNPDFNIETRLNITAMGWALYLAVKPI